MILQNIIGQRTLSDMRKMLYAHILTIRLSFYRKTQPGLVVAAITTELATVGDFIGYDLVAVMKAGEIVEMGTYDELMEKKTLCLNSPPENATKGVHRDDFESRTQLLADIPGE